MTLTEKQAICALVALALARQEQGEPHRKISFSPAGSRQH
ncbi:hypothetical protein BANRA_05726 [Klebsiella pneumoniae]|nr:hypothetical protein BANRA_05726 [Klebsiella pneumoniae]